MIIFIHHKTNNQNTYLHNFLEITPFLRKIFFALSASLLSYLSAKTYFSPIKIQILSNCHFYQQESHSKKMYPNRNKFLKNTKKKKRFYDLANQMLPTQKKNRQNIVFIINCIYLLISFWTETHKPNE